MKNIGSKPAFIDFNKKNSAVKGPRKRIFMSDFKGFKALSPSPPKYFWHWFGTERVSRQPKLLILLGFVGAVDGARTRDPRRDRPVL